MKISVEIENEKVKFTNSEIVVKFTLSKKLSTRYARHYAKIAEIFGESEKLRALFFFAHFHEKYGADFTADAFKKWKKRHWDAK